MKFKLAILTSLGLLIATLFAAPTVTVTPTSGAYTVTPTAPLTETTGAAILAATSAGTAVTPPTTIASGQQALSTSAASISALSLVRKSLLVRNLDTSISIYIGPTGVTSSNGMLLKAGETMTIYSSAAIFAIAASGTPSIATFTESTP